ncbi:MAG: hypothetical protein WC829_21100 [Hyphomicrobium sp.]
MLTEIKETNVANPLCGAVAGGYYTAVNLGGGGHFNGYEVEELMKSVNNLTDGKSTVELKQLELQGFDGKAPLHKELKLASTPLRDRQQDVSTKLPPLDSKNFKNQTLKDKLIGPGGGGGYQGGMPGAAGTGK